ncbi:MAG: MMPL family transporter [Bacteroidota bacterium]
MLFSRLRVIPSWTVRHPIWVLAIALVATLVGASQAVTLRVDANIVGLLPPEYTSVQALQRLQDTVGAETTVDVAVASPSFEANRTFAEALVPAMMALQSPEGEDYFTRVEFRRDVRFVTENALYFATFEELDRLEDFLRGQAQQVRSTTDPLRMNLFSARSDSAEAARQREADRLRTDLAQLALTEYLVSPDSTTLVVKFYPIGAQTDLGFVDRLYADIDRLVADLQPAGFHPDMEVTPAGRLLRQTIEVRSITTDVRNSFGAGVLAVILTVVLYFLYKSIQARTGGRLVWRVVLGELLRTPVTAVLLTFPLLMSLSWVGGVAAVTFGTLNLMTSTLGLILFGLGIDYGIHFYARYAEERGLGKDVPEAVEETFVSTGQGIAVSAMTTASALFVLQLADFRGFSEFGLIGGLGILFAVVSMLTVLPALLSLAERTGVLDLRLRGEASTYEPETRFPFSRTILAISAVFIVASAFKTPDVAFEYNFSNLEPEYDEYYRRAEALEPVFGQNERRNPAYILLDSSGDVRAVADALKALAEQDSLILAVESLQERFPTDSSTVARKLDRLGEIREVLNDPFLSADTTGQVERLRQAASATAPIPLDSVPNFITRPFMTREGEVGDFVIVFPRGNMADGRRSIRFSELIGQVSTPSGNEFYAASTQLVAADMLRLMQEESPLMIGVTFTLVFVLVFTSFRSVRWTLLAVAPLTVGLLLMLGLMVLFGIQLTFYNLVVLPTVLGIGNDGGVHLAHRYREEGRGSIRRVLRSTGEHVTMGALTNLIGFSGLLISGHPGLRSIGVLAVVGITATLVATLVVFPALLQVVEDTRWLDPRRRRQRRRYDLGDLKALRRPTFKLRPPSSGSATVNKS